MSERKYEYKVMGETYAPPEIVGYWIVPGGGEGLHYRIPTIKKPNWFHLKMMWWLLGWEWRVSK